MAKRAAIIGSGNIGTDLLIKLLRTSNVLEPAAMVGIDPESDGLKFARRQGIVAVDTGVEGLVQRPDFDKIDVIFDATSAKAHQHNLGVLKDSAARIVDLTPAAVGPFVVPPVNLGTHANARVVNMVTCGGQATLSMRAVWCNGSTARIRPNAYAGATPAGGAQPAP